MVVRHRASAGPATSLSVTALLCRSLRATRQPAARRGHVRRGGVEPSLDRVRALTFDVFGTILDLGASLTPPLGQLLARKGSALPAEELWAQYRYRQRIEQYQDSLLLLGHPGYLDSARRALLYVLRAAGVPFDQDDVAALMQAWQELQPFPDALDGLRRLAGRFKLVVLS